MDTGAGSYRCFLQGDDNVIYDIIAGYRDGLILYLCSIVRDINTAEELAEDTFVRLFTKRPKLTNAASFKTLLYTIGRNIAIDHIRRESRRQEIPIDECAEIRAETESIEDVLIKEERNKMLFREVQMLPPAQSQAVWLVYYEGLSTRETACIMGKSVHSVEMLLSRARAILRTKLTEGGIKL